MNYRFRQRTGMARFVRVFLKTIGFAFGLSACASLAGPHHFWPWRQGTITQLDPPQNRIVIVENHGQKKFSFIEWNKQTRFFLTTSGAGMKPVPASALAIGARVHVQTFVRWRRFIARQFIIESGQD